MIDWLQGEIAWLAYFALLLAPLALAIWLATWLLNRFAPDASENTVVSAGCALMAVIMLAALLLMAPVLDAVKSVACEDAADHDRCMNPD